MPDISDLGLYDKPVAESMPRQPENAIEPPMRARVLYSVSRHLDENHRAIFACRNSSILPDHDHISKHYILITR